MRWRWSVRWRWRPSGERSKPTASHLFISHVSSRPSCGTRLEQLPTIGTPQFTRATYYHNLTGHPIPKLMQWHLSKTYLPLTKETYLLLTLANAMASVKDFTCCSIKQPVHQPQTSTSNLNLKPQPRTLSAILREKPALEAVAGTRTR